MVPLLNTQPFEFATATSLHPVAPHKTLLEQGGIAFLHVWHFFCTIKLAPVVYPAQGVSWFELFCLFDLYGGKLLEENPASPKPRTSLKKLLDLFKSTCKHVVSTCLPRAEQLLFAVSTRPNCRLKCIGFSNFVSCIQSNLCLEHTAQMKLTHALISCRMVVTDKKAKAITKGDLHLATTRLKLKGIPTWNTFRSKVEQAPVLLSVATNSHLSVEPRQPCIFRDGTTIFLECPRCTAIKQCSKHPLFGKNGFSAVFCQGCRRTTISKTWRCLCDGKPHWFRCGHHASLGFAIAKPTKQAPRTLEEGHQSTSRITRRRLMPGDKDTVPTVPKQHGNSSKGTKRKASGSDDPRSAFDRIRAARQDPLPPPPPPPLPTLPPSVM